jgi:hypothetical protein
MKTNLKRFARGGSKTVKTTMACRPKEEANANQLTAAIITEDPSQIQKEDTCVLIMHDLITPTDGLPRPQV